MPLPINPDGTKPIYVQIAEWLETEILSGNIAADEKIYSQYQLAEMFNINPATAAKGLKLLAEQNILYKKRGLGMFVSSQAKELILHRRKNETLIHLVEELITEAQRVGLSETELLSLVQSSYQQRKGKGES
ncbi:DNA-binding transcriptional regulator YhcF (GntR family) [Caldalkalibacillus uzonensis]|uniref:DNA-binding transcriptional regulator YhcF (GntR family) n=1 Tax=Caldalkalibacillus uzonensis TaxID=353224 RepID=A0ABU0CX50_9BACI|nr:DNA-binding transcriptional regulator YhcF (GntR family) [Caldalkalibacillus uzonensis]